MCACGNASTSMHVGSGRSPRRLYSKVLHLRYLEPGSEVQYLRGSKAVRRWAWTRRVSGWVPIGACKLRCWSLPYLSDGFGGARERGRDGGTGGLGWKVECVFLFLCACLCACLSLVMLWIPLTQPRISRNVHEGVDCMSE